MPRDDRTVPLGAQAVGGRYELRDLLGRGGMGSVWRADDLLLQRPVAVKRVELPVHLPEADREALRQRVLREARAAARVGHPRLVTIFDVVEEDGTVFLVQELVDAPSLKELVTQRGPLSPVDVAAIGRQLADGLAAAHANGVVHRDVKPSNVMVRDDGSVKLADFGIASVQGDPQLTATGVVIGSPAYMAPEQAIGEKVSAAADVWSLGATLYFAVEGSQPFGKADTLSTLTAVVHDPPRPMRRADALAPVLARLLEKDPTARPTIIEVERLLAAVADRSSPTPIVERAVDDETIVAATAIEPPPVAVRAPMAAPGRRRPLGAIAALIVVVLAGGIALAAVLGQRNDGDPDVQAGSEPTVTTETPPTTADAPTTSAAPTTPAAPEAAPAVPAGWVTYRDERTGYTVAHPEGWRVQGRGGNRTDFTDPATGSYLRVDWTDKPGESAQADWERQSDAFAKNHQNYREVAITPTTFLGSDNASLWEFTYTEGGADLHAYNLGFVLGRGTAATDYGFALNFQTRADRWAASQPTWEQLKAAFAPPS